MFVIGKSSYVLIIVIIVSRSFKFANGISFYKGDKILSEDEKRGATPEIRNEASRTEKPSSKSKTEKRGLPPDGRGGHHFISAGLQPPEYDGYEPTRYSGNGGYAHVVIEHLSDDRRPPFHEYDGGYQHSGGGFIPDGPNGYGPSYGPTYLPPPKPVYYDGYDEGHRYPEQHSGGDGDHGIGVFKNHTRLHIVDYITMGKCFITVEGYFNCPRAPLEGSNMPDTGMKPFSEALTVKKILLPLAGLAILGVAAAAASHNPILLQLGTVSGRRKRALTQSDVYPPNPVVKPIKAE